MNAKGTGRDNVKRNRKGTEFVKTRSEARYKTDRTEIAKREENKW
jgi:hypothetical protein